MCKNIVINTNSYLVLFSFRPTYCMQALKLLDLILHSCTGESYSWSAKFVITTVEPEIT